MVRLLSRSVAVLLIVALATSFAFAKVETYLGPTNAELAKWKQSMQGKLATDRIVPQKAERVSKMVATDSELVPLPKTVVRNESEFNYTEAFDSYLAYFRDITGQFIFEGLDSMGVWFRPATDCRIKKIEVLWCDDGANENLGGTFNIRIFDVPDDLTITDATQTAIGGNGAYDFSLYEEIIPSPAGALLGEYEMVVTQTGFNEETGWSVANLEDLGGAIDVGQRDFFVAFEFPAGNSDDADVYYGPAEELHAPGDYHSYKWYHTGGSYSPGIPNWVSRLNYSMRAYVEYYGDPPPTIADVTSFNSVYYSCDQGPWTVEATVTDLGTDAFTGEVTNVKLIYFTETVADADTIDITASKNGDVYSGDIPSHPVGTQVYYYIQAEDNGADDSGVEDPVTHVSKTTPVFFYVLEANPDATVLIVRDGSNEDADMYASVMEEGGWIFDVWDIAELGSPTVCALQKYSSLFWLSGQGTGGNLSADSLDLYVLPDYLDAGGNLFLVSSDYIGAAEGGNYTGEWTEASHSFVLNYLKVTDYASDINADDNGDSSDSLYMDLDDNVISSFLGDDTLMVAPITKMIADGLTGYNYADEVAPAADASVPFYVWNTADNEWFEASTMYDGDFKMIFLPWYLEAAVDLDQFDTVVKNILGFFGEKAAPLVGIESGPRYCVAANSGPYAVVASATDGDGTVASVELGTSSDGLLYTYAAMTANAGVYEGSIGALNVDDTLFFQIRATDNDGLNGYAGPWAFNMIDFTPVNTDLLYCGDDPYYAYYVYYGYPYDVDSIMIASLDRIGASYDFYDVDANGYIAPSYIGFLDQYESVIWHGYADWEMSFPYATADNPFMPFIENGGNLLFSSGEMVGTHLGWDGYVDTEPGQSVRDVLGISWYAPDMGYYQLQIYPGAAGVGMDASFELDTLIGYWGHMGDLVDPVDWTSQPLLDAWVPGWGVWYGEDWDCYTAWWNQDADNGSQRVIVPFPLAAMNDANRDAFLTNVIAGFGTGVAVEEAVETLPKAFALKQNFPNPFNPITSIAFEMPSDQNVRLTVYNMLGQNVRTLVNDQRSAGRYTILWDGRDDAGHMVGSGVYFYQIQAGSFTKTAKMVFLK